MKPIVAVLDDNGTRLLTRRESPTDPPNYFIRAANQLEAPTRLSQSDAPSGRHQKATGQLQARRRRTSLVHPLSSRRIISPGTKLPAVVWAYPYEFSDAATAGQVTGHEAQSFPELNYHQLVVLHGYALLDNAAMPIIGDAETVNNTYVEQIQMDAQAAVDKAVEMGVADREPHRGLRAQLRRLHDRQSAGPYQVVSRGGGRKRSV